VEASNVLLDGPITNGDALMLAQVLEPGLDDERFDITPLMLIGLTPNATMDSVARWAGLTSPSL